MSRRLTERLCYAARTADRSEKRLDALWSAGLPLRGHLKDLRWLKLGAERLKTLHLLGQDIAHGLSSACSRGQYSERHERAVRTRCAGRG